MFSLVEDVSAMFSPTTSILIVRGPLCNFEHEALSSEKQPTFLTLEDGFPADVQITPEKIVFSHLYTEDSLIEDVKLIAIQYPMLEFVLIYWSISENIYGYYNGECYISSMNYGVDYEIYDENDNIVDYDGPYDICKPIGSFKKLLEEYDMYIQEL